MPPIKTSFVLPRVVFFTAEGRQMSTNNITLENDMWDFRLTTDIDTLQYVNILKHLQKLETGFSIFIKSRKNLIDYLFISKIYF